jgi:hypothetical protein
MIQSWYAGKTHRLRHKAFAYSLRTICKPCQYGLCPEFPHTIDIYIQLYPSQLEKSLNVLDDLTIPIAGRTPPKPIHPDCCIPAYCLTSIASPSQIGGIGRPASRITSAKLFPGEMPQI